MSWITIVELKPGETYGTKALDVCKHLFPPSMWLPKYRREHLKGDLLAGLTTAVLLVPQGMAYAFLAGVPPVYGLYSSFVPLILYATFASSNFLSFGPAAPTAIMLAAAVNEEEPETPELYLEMILTISLICGIIRLIMAVLRLGFVVKFLSRPVMKGFLTGVAIIIMTSQAKDLLGIKVPSTDRFYLDVWNLIEHIEETNGYAVLVSVVSVCFLYGCEKVPLLPRWFPKHILLFAAAISASYAADLNRVMNIAIVGEVPDGLPEPKLPNMHLAPPLIVPAVLIVVVAYAAAITLGTAFALEKNEDLDANQELLAAGISATVGSFFGGFCSNASLSRSALNYEMGAKTPLASIITACFIALTLLVLTPLCEFLPKGVLAATIVVAVRKLVDFREPLRLWRMRFLDLTMWTVTFVAILSLGIEMGLITAVGYSVGMYLYRSTQPAIPSVGRGSDGKYRLLDRYADAMHFDDLEVLRLPSELYFGSVDAFKERVRLLLLTKSATFSWLIIDCSHIAFLDSSSVDGIMDIMSAVERRGKRTVFAAPPEGVRSLLLAANADFFQGKLCGTLGEAIDQAMASPNRQAVEEDIDEDEVDKSAFLETGGKDYGAVSPAVP